MLKEMMRHIEGTTNKGQIMFELATRICAAVDVDLINLYLVETEGDYKICTRRRSANSVRYYIFRFYVKHFRPTKYKIGPGSTIAAFCSNMKNVTRATNSGKDTRYPEGVPEFTVFPLC